MQVDTSADDLVLAEVRDGVLSRGAIHMVTRAAVAVTRTGRFTTPNGARRWSRDDVEDLVGDFFAKPGRLFDIATAAGTGPDAVQRFQAQIEKRLKWLLVDRLRKGPQGALYKRIDRRVARRDDIVDVAPGHWSLEAWSTEPHWGGNDDLLDAAVAASPIDPPPAWPDDSPRVGPATTGASVDRLCTVVLDTAASPVPRNTVRRVVADRVIPFDPGVVAEDPLNGDPAGPPDPDPFEIEAAHLAAATFWDLLSDEDRQLLPLLALPPRQVEANGFLGLKKSAIGVRQQRLTARLQTFLAKTPDPDLVDHALMQLQHQWAAGQTTGGST